MGMMGAWIVLLSSCSTPKCVPDNDQLFAGLTKINYVGYEKSDYGATAREEIEAALATAPNGALFGSSYYRTPFPYGLWIWNAFSGSKSVMGKWVVKAFGKEPVLLSRVNPALRASVAQEVLRSYGWFHGRVSHEAIPQKNPREAKIRYTVDMGPLFTIDTLEYVNFPEQADSLIEATRKKAAIQAGNPFSVSALDAERSRISNLFRNNGYFYYQPGYASYLADTLQVPEHVQLRLQLADDIPEKARRKWYIGKTDLYLRKRFRETLNDSIQRRRLTVHFNGRRSPMRPRVVMKDLKLRSGQLYSYDNHQQSASKITGSGIFSMVDFVFTPRDTTATCDTLDLALSCVFDKPYDFYVEANAIGKTSGALGPGVVLGLTKRNAFRGGEKLDVNLHGSYEWQTGHQDDETSSRVHSYEYGADVSLEMPRLLLPFKLRRRWYATPSTTLKGSSNVVNRSAYFKRHIVSGEMTYRFQPNAHWMHEYSPLILQYEYMTHQTEAFKEILQSSPYLTRSMADQLVPKMRYTVAWTNAATSRCPFYWQTTVSEASNLLSLGYAAFGEPWDREGKKMFKNPFAQFLKVESQIRKTWPIGEHSTFVAHADAGIVWSYGNAKSAPYSEQFYVGGANSVRAFNVRSIGPGSYRASQAKFSYMDQTGDIKLQANLEYRPRLVGNIYGALFIDAGNVWALRDDGYRADSRLQLKNLLRQTALGTGIGLRYDLEFLVLRLDWGVALHVPYKDGFYNVSRFSDGQCLHFAVGYPF